jgi:hypothetical protein
MHNASLKQISSDLQLIEERIQSVPPTVPKDAAMANRRLTEHEQHCIMPFEDMTSKDEDGNLKESMASIGIIDTHKNDFEVELIRRLNTVEGKYGQMESELDAICLKIEGIRSELDSLGQVRPRAVAASTPSHPSHSKSVLDTDAPALPVFFRQMCCWDRSRGPFNNRCPSCQSASSIFRRDCRRRGHGSVQCP